MHIISPLLYTFVHAVIALCWGNLLYTSNHSNNMSPLTAIAVLLGTAMAAIQIGALLDDLYEKLRAQDEKNAHKKHNTD